MQCKKCKINYIEKGTKLCYFCIKSIEIKISFCNKWILEFNEECNTNSIFLKKLK